MNNIYLIGFMGAGKSTIGRLISKNLNRSFYDTDELIEQKAKQTIPDIFNKRGESGFRELEAEIVGKVSTQKEAVVALGGGAVINNKSWKILESTGFTFYLKWPDKILLKRILHSQHRPLVTENDLTERGNALQKKLDLRQERYHQATHIIECYAGMSPQEIAEQIIHLLEQK